MGLVSVGSPSENPLRTLLSGGHSGGLCLRSDAVWPQRRHLYRDWGADQMQPGEPEKGLAEAGTAGWRDEGPQTQPPWHSCPGHSVKEAWIYHSLGERSTV